MHLASTTALITGNKIVKLYMLKNINSKKKISYVLRNLHLLLCFNLFRILGSVFGPFGLSCNSFWHVSSNTAKLLGYWFFLQYLFCFLQVGSKYQEGHVECISFGFLHYFSVNFTYVLNCCLLSFPRNHWRMQMIALSRTLWKDYIIPHWLLQH